MKKIKLIKYLLPVSLLMITTPLFLISCSGKNDSGNQNPTTPDNPNIPDVDNPDIEGPVDNIPSPNLINVDASYVYEHVSNIIGQYNETNYNNSKTEIINVLQKENSEIIIEKVSFEYQNNFLNITIITKQEKGIKAINDNPNFIVEKDKKTIKINNLSLTTEINKITINVDFLYEKFSYLVSKFSTTGFDENSLKNEITKIIKTNYPSIKINRINIIRENKDLKIEITTNQTEEIVLQGENKDIVLTNNKTININNLKLYDGWIPETPIMPKPNPKPDNQLATVQNNPNSNIKIKTLKASINKDNIVSLNIKGENLPTKYVGYDSDWKIIINGSKELSTGWSFTSPISNSDTDFTITQTVPILEGQIVRIEIRDKTNNEKILSNEARVVFEGEPIKFTPPIEGIDYFIAPWCPKGEENNDKYKIVNPLTKNEWVNYYFGKAPLPMVKELTDEDLYNCFYNYVLKKIGGNLSVGKRMIESDKISDQFSKWILENWNYFPYWATSNGSLYFNNAPIEVFRTYKDIEKGAWITSFNGNIWKDNFMYEGPDKEHFSKVLQTFFNTYARPGMKDLDKVAAAFLFTTELIKYNGGGVTSAWLKGLGSCTHYSDVMAQVLTFLGVEALSVGTNPNDLPAKAHRCVWVKLDLNENNCNYCGKEEHKKWYLSDPTFADNRTSKYNNHPVSKGFYSTECTSYILRSIIDNPNNKTTYDPTIDPFLENQKMDDLHNNYFEYNRARWFTPYATGEVSFSNYVFFWDDFWIKKVDTNRTKACFYNGDWYWLEYKKSTSGNYEVEFIKYNMYTKKKENILSSIPNDIVNKIFKQNLSESYYHYGMTQFGDNFIFIDVMGKTPSTNKNVYIHNMNKPWDSNNIFTIKLPEIFNNKEIENFYVNSDGELVINCKYEDTTTTIKETSKYLNFKNSNVEYTNEDVNMAKTYYDVMSGFSKIGNKNYEITVEDKKQFYIDTKNIVNSSNTAKEKIKQMDETYKKFINKSIKFNQLFVNGLVSDVYGADWNSFNQYGTVDIPLPSLYTTSSDISSNMSNSTRYDVYYSPSSNNKDEMQLFQEGLEKVILNKKWYKDKKPDGYYYFNTYINGRKENTMTQTDVIEFKTTNNQWYGLLPSGVNGTYSNTNYNENDYSWDEKSISLMFSPQDVNQTAGTTELKFASFKDKTIKTIETFYGTSGSYALNDVNVNNAGIYWFEQRYNHNGKTYKFYGKFNFVLDSSFKTDFDYEKIVTTINQIKKN